MSAKDTRYWDEVAQTWSSEPRQTLWRSFCDRINGHLIRGTFAQNPEGRALKTDLFDEATGTRGLVPELARTAAKLFGVDLSPVSCRVARQRHPSLGACASDARALPFSDQAFDVVLSNSTLDHMESVEDIATALAEIHRVLRPGGRLLLTLDNLSNPVIALRDILPDRVLTGLRLVPYYVGATCGPRRLRALVEQAGLELEEIGAVMHCPRMPAVLIANLLDRVGSDRLAASFSNSLLWWEKLERLPTRYLTGYFIRVVAIRH